MKQDPSRGGASSPVYDTVRRGLAESMFDTAKQALRDEQQRRRSQALRTGFAPAPAEKPKKENPWLSALKTVGGAVISIPATGADIVAKPFEAIPGFPDVNPEDVGSFNFFVQGGKSLQHAYGDAKELTRSIITGKDTLSQSPTAQAYQAAGGGLTGTLAAAGPYLDLGSVVAPMAMGAARGAGVVAPKAVPYKPLTNADIPATPYRATRNALAEDITQAQVPRPTVTPATMSPRLEVPTMAPTVPEVTAPQAGRTMNPRQELAQAQARAETHIGTVSRGPVDEISTEFPELSSYYVDEGGVPDPSSGRTNTFSMPVYDVDGKKVAFGPKSLGRYSPEFKNTDVEIIPIDPYAITGQSAGSKLGDEYAELFFDAVYQDTPNSPQSGQMSALLYAASRGDEVAMRELQSVANANRALMAQERSAYYTKRLAFMGDQPSSYDWAANYPNEMVIVGRDETGAAITRPATIDDLFVVHQTSYKPTYDKSGNIVIKPTGDHVYIDPATGKPAVDKVTGELLDSRRDTIHFTLNHPVAGHVERPTPTSKTYTIVVPLRDVLDANPESLDNLLSVDTWFTPKPGEGLVIPMKSGQVVELSSVNDYAKQQGLTYVEIKLEDLADTPYEILSYRNDIATQNTMQNNALVQEALRRVGQAHNQNPDYQTKLFPIGQNFTRDEAIGRRITFLAGEEIPAQYPSLGTSVSNDLHYYTPIGQFEQKFDRYIKPGTSRRIGSQDLWSLSPNARKRLFRRNTFMSGKFEAMTRSVRGL